MGLAFERSQQAVDEAPIEVEDPLASTARTIRADPGATAGDIQFQGSGENALPFEVGGELGLMIEAIL